MVTPTNVTYIDYNMAKRKNPFGEATPLQQKMHIGVKEAASKEDKEKVYAHTRAMLFQGANPSASRETLQAVGGLNGFIEPQQQSSKEAPPSLAAPQTCCHCKSKSVVVVCTDCDKRLCQRCVQQCCVCCRQFCQYCTVLNYSESDVRSFCLNCIPVNNQ